MNANLKKYFIQSGLYLLIAGAGLFAGYLLFRQTPLAAAKPGLNITSINTTPDNIEEADSPVSLSNDPSIETLKITPSTKMVYEYYYEEDGIIEKNEEIPPYFLIDMTEENLKRSFNDWTITKFTPEEVIMRKVVSGKSNQYYVIGEQEGYVAVFYEMETNGTCLKEITDTPLSALSEDEQKRLREGIHVFGEDALVRILEDFN